MTRASTRRRAHVAAVVLVACWLLLGVLAADRAGAHAVLLSESPAADSLVDVAPSRVRLDFSEGVSAPDDAVRLLAPDGAQVVPTGVEATDTLVTAELPPLEAQGSYTVTWKVVSADGHPIRGAFLFHLGERTLDAPAGGGEDPGTPMSANVVRALGATAALGGAVLLFTLLLAHSTPDRRRGVLGWAPVVLGTVLLSVGALLAVDSDLGSALDVVLDTTSGRMAALAAGAAVLGLASAAVRAPATVQLALAAATVLAVAAQGHAVSLPPVARSVGLTVVHVAAALVWLVALWWLLARVRAGADDDGVLAAARRGSPFGIVAVIVLAATGGILVWERVPLDELLSSTYGRLSLLKLALLGVAVVMALRNRLRILPAGDVGRLTRAVRAEVVVLALALVAGTVLAQVPPPERGAAQPAGGDVVERVAFGEGQVELRIEPGVRGTNEVHVTALGPDGRLMEGVDDLALSMSLPSADIGPLEPDMQRITTGHSVAYAEIPLAGEWEMRVTSRPSRFEELRADLTVPIGG